MAALPETKKAYVCVKCVTKEGLACVFDTHAELATHQEKVHNHYPCKQCTQVFDTSTRLEKHGWMAHPSDLWQRTWREAAVTGFKNCSTFYQDDPYY